MKPLLLLDVDGVLCPFLERPFAVDVRRGVIESNYEGFAPEGFELDPTHNLWVSKRMAERVQDLTHTFEIHWCTGWQHQANNIIGPLHNLEAFPVVEIDIEKDGPSFHWKSSGIIAHVGDRPFAFIDDDIYEESMEWAEKRSREVAPTLFVQTLPSVGMTDDHVNELVEWAREIETKESSWAGPADNSWAGST